MNSPHFFPYYYVLYNFFFWLVAYLYTKNNERILLLSGTNGKFSFPLLFIIVLAYSVFTFFGGDTFTYKEIIEEGFSEGYFYNEKQVESLYLFVATLVGGNYYMWKLVIYTFAILLTFQTYKELKINNSITWYVFVILIMTSYGSSRAVLAYAMFSFGLALIISKNRKKRFLSLLLFAGTVMAHTSMLPIVVISLLGRWRLSTKKIIFLLILFPFIVVGINVLLASIGANDAFLDTYIGYKFGIYTEEEGNAGTNLQALSLVILSILEYVVLIPILFITLRSETKSLLDKRISIYIRISFFVVYFSLILRFLDLNNTEYLFKRYFDIFPFVIIPALSYLYQNRQVNKKMMKYIDATSFARCVYWFVMMMYIQWANGAV